MGSLRSTSTGTFGIPRELETGSYRLKSMKPEMVLVAALITVIAAVSCSSESEPAVSTTSAPSPVATIPVPTVPRSDSGELALFTAVLEWDPNGECIYGVGDDDADGLPLVFPAGYSALADRHAIVDESGAVVAEEGDRVDLVGGRSDLVDGSIGAFGVSNVPCPDGPVWVVQHPIEPASE